MVSREELKKYFDEKEVKQTIFTEIQSLGSDAQEIITTYCIQWFHSYFDKQVNEEDFLEEIRKLNEPECETKLIDLIRKKIFEMETKAKKVSKEETNNNNNAASAQIIKGSTIHDRIKPKTLPAQNFPPSANNNNNNSADKSAAGQPKKQVKILQKDEQKLKKANEAIESQNNNSNNGNNNANNAANNNIEENDESLIKELEDKKKQRCKYFPNCKNERTCPYIHPTEPCSFFPTCKYGGQCINKHPDCKYGKSCQRPDCFYEHPFPKKQAMNPFLQMLMMPMMNPQKRKMNNKPNGKRPFPGNGGQQGGAGDEQKSEDKQQI